jgi:hypothetical protein
VTEVKLSLEDLRRVDFLPAMCARCGRKSAGFRRMRLTTSEGKQSSFWGWIFWELGWWTLKDKESFENLSHEIRITKGWLKLPVCWRHRWIVPPFIGMRMVNERTVALSHVSPDFVAALRGLGWVR